MMRHIVFCFAAFLSLSLFAGAAEMKLMSFNVCHCSGMDGKIDIGRTAERIKAEDPDFACLQDLDWCTARSEGGRRSGLLRRIADAGGLTVGCT